MKVFYKIGIILGIIAILGLSYWTYRVFRTEIFEGSGIEFTITSGEGIDEISENLVLEGVLDAKWVFQSYVFVRGYRSDFREGTFFIEDESSIHDVVLAFVENDPIPKEVTLRFIEGWNINEMQEYLEEAAPQFSEDFGAVARGNDAGGYIGSLDYGFLTSLPNESSLEGFLFPDTYRVFTYGDSYDVIDRMLDAFESKITDPEVLALLDQTDLTLYEVVTLASIVEHEGRTEEDRRMVADVFLKRLDIGMPLQSDATVNYVTGKSETRPTYDDLDVVSPYNTYQINGLPIGPICNPSLESIMAVLDPIPNDYFYFLMSPEGQTYYAETGVGHNANKAKYLD